MFIECLSNLGVIHNIFPIFSVYLPGDRTSVIPIEDPVWINHRYDYKGDIFPQKNRERVGGDDEIHQSVTHVRSRALSWVHPRSDEHNLSRGGWRRLGLVPRLTRAVWPDCDHFHFSMLHGPT